MGEMADYYLELDPIEHEPEDSDTHPGYTCRYCQTQNLWWYQIMGKWRLCTRTREGSHSLHVCPVNPVKDRPKQNKQR